MNDFDAELDQRLNQIREQGLYRELRRIDSPQASHIEIGGKNLINFSSNDYLGLANHPLLKEATVKAVEKFGSGSGASRLICGSLAPHFELEETIAAFKGTESALSFSSGYAAAIGTICALLGKEDIIVLDKLVHASIVDAARLSGARLRVFSHNDLNELEDILRWCQSKTVTSASDTRRPRTLVVTESVFSMDGDLAPLREIVALKEKYSAWLMVDEAHATGLFGQHRRGMVEQLGLSNQIEVQMGTLGKALGSAGGYICGSKSLTNYLINRARSFIFSTAPVPAASAAATAAIKLVQSAEGAQRSQRLWNLLKLTREMLSESGWNLSEIRSAILPLIVGEEEKAVQLAANLRERGVYIPAIRYPTVALGSARLRLTMTASHTPDDITKLHSALSACIL